MRPIPSSRSIDFTTVDERADMRGREKTRRGLGPFTGGQLTAIVIALAAVVALPMIASAAIPNGNTYNACALKTSGALRVIDTSKHQTCKTTETAISWSKTGARGPQGAPGVNGTNGAAGATGANGTNGAAGATGASGVVTMQSLAGPVAQIALSVSVLQFIGPTRSVSVTDNQEITASATLSLYNPAELTGIYLDICWKQTFVGGSLHEDTNYMYVGVDQTRRTFTTTNTYSLAAGIYTVGACATTDGLSLGNIFSNTGAQGFVTVTNS
jgi:hypothetical protein